MISGYLWAQKEDLVNTHIGLSSQTTSEFLFEFNLEKYRADIDSLSHDRNPSNQQKTVGLFWCKPNRQFLADI